MGIRACQAVMPNTPQVAVFDTAFHMTMPPKAYRYAIPKEYYENDDIRRYGFHGTSHKYVAKRTAELVGKKNFKMVNCHLGNGSSLSAIKDGKCMDTSMGLSPLAGVPMGTRSGDIDPCVVQFICNKYGMSVDDCLTMLNKKSGMLACPACPPTSVTWATAPTRATRIASWRLRSSLTKWPSTSALTLPL